MDWSRVAPKRERGHDDQRAIQGPFAGLAWDAAGLALAIGVGDARAAFPGANGQVAFTVEKWRLPDPCLPIPHGCDAEVFSSSIETVLPSGRGRPS